MRTETNAVKNVTVRIQLRPCHCGAVRSFILTAVGRFWLRLGLLRLRRFQLFEIHSTRIAQSGQAIEIMNPASSDSPVGLTNLWMISTDGPHSDCSAKSLSLSKIPGQSLSWLMYVSRGELPSSALLCDPRWILPIESRVASPAKKSPSHPLRRRLI